MRLRHNPTLALTFCFLLVHPFARVVPAQSRAAVPVQATPLIASAEAPVQAQVQAGVQAGDQPELQSTDLQRRLEAMTSALQQTRQTLLFSLQQIQQMQSELDALKASPSTTAAQPPPTPATRDTHTDTQLLPPVLSATPTESSSLSGADQVTRLADEQQALQAEIKQHDQTKIETASKYPLRVSGLVLFNLFSNSGVVDNINVPALALARPPGVSHGSFGATMRQTVLGLEARGPDFAHAHSSATASVDFFGDVSTALYNSSAGSVRLRRASASILWPHTTAEVGVDVPLISPLSPTSYATVAEPGLSWAGNLWLWVPQLRIEQRIPLVRGRDTSPTLGLEFGLLDPQPAASGADYALLNQSAGEQVRRPALEGRLSLRGGSSARPFSLGAGGYTSRQTYNQPYAQLSSQTYSATTALTAWAVTGDWQIPLGPRLALRGEAYRGSGLGTLGGGAFKDALYGFDRLTYRYKSIGLNAAGGWSELKVRLLPSTEINAAFGLDNAFAADFRVLKLTAANANPLQFYARNQVIVGNIIFHPRAYLIFSPEYRRIASREVTGPTNLANLFTLSFGYQF